jgi:hypothetical protein
MKATALSSDGWPKAVKGSLGTRRLLEANPSPIADSATERELRAKLPGAGHRKSSSANPESSRKEREKLSMWRLYITNLRLRTYAKLGS